MIITESRNDTIINEIEMNVNGVTYIENIIKINSIKQKG